MKRICVREEMGRKQQMRFYHYETRGGQQRYKYMFRVCFFVCLFFTNTRAAG